VLRTAAMTAALHRAIPLAAAVDQLRRRATWPKALAVDVPQHGGAGGRRLLGGAVGRSQRAGVRGADRSRPAVLPPVRPLRRPGAVRPLRRPGRSHAGARERIGGGAA